MMNFEQVTTSYIDAEKYPWIPFAPYSDEVFLKILKCDPVSGTFLTLLKVPGNTALPKHHHCGTVFVYTVKGTWRYLEHDWTAVEGSVVYETAATSHTPTSVGNDEVITFNMQVGDSIFLDDQGGVLAIENWKTMLQRHLDWHRARGLEAVDITSFSG
jgi:hypothetical protein